MKHVLVITQDAKTSQQFKSFLGNEYKVESAADPISSLRVFASKRCEFVFIDISLLSDKGENGQPNYKTQLQPFWNLNPASHLVVLARTDQIRQAVNAVKAGASDYLTYPVDPEEVRFLIDSLTESTRFQEELDYLRDSFWASDVRELVRTDSAAMKQVYAKVRAVAPTKATVFLSGETGTGKSLLAKLIHQHSHRRSKPFLAVHCGAIPESLVESELFGHERGAFTGAIRRKLGKFEIAHEGTIFLDEIGTISPSTQVKMLQVLQDGTFQRVGGEITVTVDVRVIAATNADLKRLCDEGGYRTDLFYRLNVFPIEVPPLRARTEDIALLVEAFIRNLNRYHQKDIVGVHSEVLEALQTYSWPGNIRELENIIERAYILERSSILMPESFPEDITGGMRPLPGHPAVDVSLSLAQNRKRNLESTERFYLIKLLEKHKGRINSAAEAAGITTRQLHKLMTKYNLRKEAFK